jgi:DNA-binding SARP family transcriptional activator
VLTRPVQVRTCREADDDPSFPRLHLRLVDAFGVTHVDDGVVHLAPLCERLITFLAVRGPSPRHQLAFQLWSDRSEEHALSCLRTALWRLPRPGGDQLVRADATTLRLADSVDVDVHRRYAEAAAWADGTRPPAGLKIDGFAADILRGWYEDWAIMEQERYRQMRLHMLERLSRWATRSGRFADAIMAGGLAAEGGPLRESAHRCLVRAHLAEGNLDEAVRQVRSFLAELRAADLPVRLSSAMIELLPHDAVRLLAPSADR